MEKVIGAALIGAAAGFVLGVTVAYPRHDAQAALPPAPVVEPVAEPVLTRSICIKDCPQVLEHPPATTEDDPPIRRGGVEHVTQIEAPIDVPDAETARYWVAYWQNVYRRGEALTGVKSDPQPTRP